MTHYEMDGSIFVLKRDVMGNEWHGHGANPEFTPLPMPAGSRVRVVMASRFGDVGITPHLDDERGYVARCCPGALEGGASCSKLPEHRHPCAECSAV